PCSSFIHSSLIKIPALFFCSLRELWKNSKVGAKPSLLRRANYRGAKPHLSRFASTFIIHISPLTIIYASNPFSIVAVFLSTTEFQNLALQEG
ncbi:hypothetical protein PJI17_31290, partial [Mycobacterium kansasii]